MSTWYSDGTIEVAEGGDVATGTGTAFLANVRVGDGIAIAGSATLHEVTNIASNQQLTFQPPFAGQAGSALAYRIAPVQGYVKRAADRLAQIVAEYGDTLAALGDEETVQLVIELAENITPAGLELMGKATAAEQRQVLGLERVDNTPDAEKPVSAPQLQALDAKADAEQTAQALAGKVDKEAGKGLSQNDFTDALHEKLSTIEGSKWKGRFLTFSALEAAFPVGEDGWVAWVDAGPGQPVKAAIWDENDSQWRMSQSEGGMMTPAQVLEALKANPDVNVLTDAQLAKLVETLVFSQADKNKLDAIQAEAQKNPDAVSQAEAQAGTSTELRSWSVLRVWQAIQAWWNASAMKTKLDGIPAFPPADGKSYVWTNGAWVESQQTGGGSELLSVEFFHGYRSALATERPGCVPIDGQLLTRSMWPEAIGKILAGNLYPLQPSDTAWNSSWANKRQFSPGDGSTTIRNMDWNGATGGKAVFVRGSPADSFSLKEDMLRDHNHPVLGGGGTAQATSGTFGLYGGSSAATANTSGDTSDPSYYVKGNRSDKELIGKASLITAQTGFVGNETVPPHADGVWIIRMAKAGAGSNPGTVDVTALASEQVAQGSRVSSLEAKQPTRIGYNAAASPAPLGVIPADANKVTVILSDITYTASTNLMLEMDDGQGNWLGAGTSGTITRWNASAVGGVSWNAAMNMLNSGISAGSYTGKIVLEKNIQNEWVATMTFGGKTAVWSFVSNGVLPGNQATARSLRIVSSGALSLTATVKVEK